ncbi:MAG TPA: VIT domain-containing protein [Planctomycetota bacterium]|nr:VIT domain-containing protein [Planctomycetota bacterium]
MRRLLLLGLVVGCAASVANDAGERRCAPTARVDEEPSLVSPDGPLDLETLTLEAEVVSGIVSATLDLVFKNDLARVLEGQLMVPLPDGAMLDGFALDVGGEMREGTLVERERARVAFESVERRGVDPGLVEWSHGSTFRARVYPIPARGRRHARIHFSQEVGSRVVLDFGPRLRGELVDGYVIVPVKGRVVRDLAVQKWAEGTRDGSGAFLAQVPVGRPRDVPLPPRVTVIDDVSKGALGRDRVRERQVLERALQGGSELRLVTFAHEVLSVEKVASVGDLVAKLDAAVLDGAARLSCLDLAKLESDTDALIVLTDGVAALGTAATPGTKRTVSLASGRGADLAALGKLGEVVNLAELGVDEAVKCVRSLPRSVEVPGALEVFPGRLRGDVLTVAGRLPESAKSIDVLVTEGPEIRRFTVPLAAAEGASRVLARRRVESLLQARPVDVAAVISLAKAERLATPYTSFVVLETFEDYRRYGVDPPESDTLARRLKLGIEALQTDKFAKAEDIFEQVLEKDPWNEHAQKFLELAKEGRHWEEGARFAGKSEREGTPFLVERSEEPNTYTPSNKVVMFPEDLFWRERVQRRGIGISTRGEDQGFFRRREVVEGQVARLTQLRTSLETDRATLARLYQNPEHAIGVSDELSSGGTGIEVAPTAPPRHLPAGIAALASATDLDGVYFHVRSMDPAFFVDAAEIYAAHNQHARAVRVLTNLAALDPGDPATLRVLAYRLEELHETTLALEVLERVASLRPEEPQSFRDLALLQADLGNVSSATANLAKVERGKWDSRFPEIDKIAARERAHLTQPTATALDLRVVLTWDADATDVDLWVTEPSGEKVLYSHPTSKEGGHLSKDFTQGYGPEEFVLAHAPRGDYRIEAHFYGDRRQTRATDTTIKATIFTDYGAPEEKREVFLHRMSERKEIVEIARVTMK